MRRSPPRPRAKFPGNSSRERRCDSPTFTDRGQQFATLDYSDAEPRIYVGDEVPLVDLGFAVRRCCRKRSLPKR